MSGVRSRSILFDTIKMVVIPPKRETVTYSNAAAGFHYTRKMFSYVQQHGIAVNRVVT